MMTLPGEQFVIRRQAYAMIKKAFDENGIKFAFPTVQVAGEGDSSAATAAVAQRAGTGQARCSVARPRRRTRVLKARRGSLVAAERALGDVR
jgi:small-conductance mechanosensitive channel